MENQTKRNRKTTEQKILEAYHEEVMEKGFEQTGINLVAKRSGYSKVLIYRYFGGWEGLHKKYIDQHDFWDTHFLSDEKHVDKLIMEFIRDQVEQLKEDRILRQMIRWELNDRNQITEEISQRRNESAKLFIKEVKSKLPLLLKGRDVEAFYIIITSAIYYLSLKKDTIDIISGIELNSEKGWGRIEKVIKQMLKAWLWG